MLNHLLKAAVGAIVNTPVAIVADVVTLGGALTDKNESFTAKALSDVGKNLDRATRPY